MPDLPNRAAHEREFTTGLVNIFADLKKQAIDNPNNIDWGEVRDKINADVNNSIMAVYLLSLRGMNGYFDTPIEENTASAMAMRYASNRSASLSSEMVMRLRDGVLGANQQAINAIAIGAEVDSARAAFETRVDAIFSDTKAESIGVTEITGTISAAEIESAEEANRRLATLGTALTLRPYWYTEEDSRVCPICAPLHGKPRTQWDSENLGGPPAHVNCRCWLTWVRE